jgi:hypothetical protein
MSSKHIVSTAKTTAKKVLQNRALQCSFTSVFHIKKTATTAQHFKEAKVVEDIFLKAVALPMAFMSAIGTGALVWKEYVR